MSKLDWMYKSSNSVDPEDYLLGKAIDKNFEAQGSSKNEVDKDILPTSIFANSNSNAPVDIFRKIKEDPLEQIKQKEIEMKKQLLKNPVKLKKLQSMLKARAEKKDHKKKKKKSKSKDIDDRLAKLLQKYGAKTVMELTKSGDSEEEENEKSKKKSKKTKQRKDRSDSSFSSDENSRSRGRDGQGRKSSRDRCLKYKDKKTNVIRRRSGSASSCERQKSRKNTHLDHRTSRDDRDRRRRHRSESDEGDSDSGDRKAKSGKDKPDKAQDLMNVYARLIEKHGAQKLMELVSDDSEEEKSKQKKKKKSRGRSDPSESGDGSESQVRKSDHRKKQSAGSAKRKCRRRSSSENSSSDGDRSGMKDDTKKSNYDASTREQSRKLKQRASSSSSYSPDDDDDEELKNMKANAGTRLRDDSSDEGKSTFKKAYGLVLPKGVEAKPRSSSRPAAESSTKKVDDLKGKFVRPKPSKLTEEEKEAKLKEMMVNAQWRDKERKTNVAKYREEEKREAGSQKYDEGFMRKELAKAVDSSKSVEERIKSRMNNVQRSKFSMSQNFARRN